MFESNLILGGGVARSYEEGLFQRFPIAIQMNLRAMDNSVPIRLKTADISIGVCYVEMSVTFEPGTVLHIILWLDNEKLSLQGRVVTKHPHFGNGIEFMGLTPEGQDRLWSFLEKRNTAG